ncbi:MAG: PAS domain S-box protein, partial [Deltaproteobacteria bacterium]|nr:PAS domain S-box protein [Deltaproteobacteria bacterium]
MQDDIITRRKQIEQALREDKGFFRHLVESANAVPWEVDLDTFRFTYIGPQAVALLGYPVEDWYQEDFWIDHLHPEDREEAVSFCQVSTARGEDHDFEYRMIAADDREVWILDSVNVVKNDTKPVALQGYMFDITKQKLATEALSRRKAEFEAMFNSITDAVIFADTERRIVMNNPAVQAMFGYSDEELIGQTTELLYADKQDFKDQGSRRYRAGPDAENAPYEVRYRRKDGTVFWTETVGTQVKDANGTTIGFIGMFRDITERKRSETKLRDSESLLAKAQSVAHLGSWDLNLDTGKAVWSEEMYRILGYEPYAVEAEPKNLLARIHPEDKDYAMQELERPFQDKNKKYQAEFRIIQPNKRVRIVAERGRLIYDGLGKAQRYIGTTLDITERKEAEEKIRASEKELGAILNSLQDVYYRVDLEGSLTRVSPSVQKLLGYTPKQLLGKKLADLYVDPQGREKFLRELAKQAGVVENYQSQLQHKDGHPVWVSTNAHYIRDKQGNPIGVEGTTRDIGQLKAAEDLNSRFGRILDNSSNEIYVYDADTLHFTQVNRGARQNLGYSMREMEQLTPLDLKPDHTRESFSELMQPLYRGKKKQIVFQTRHQRKDGSL